MIDTSHPFKLRCFSLNASSKYSFMRRMLVKIIAGSIQKYHEQLPSLL